MEELRKEVKEGKEDNMLLRKQVQEMRGELEEMKPKMDEMQDQINLLIRTFKELGIPDPLGTPVPKTLASGTHITTDGKQTRQMIPQHIIENALITGKPSLAVRYLTKFRFSSMELATSTISGGTKKGSPKDQLSPRVQKLDPAVVEEIVEIVVGKWPTHDQYIKSSSAEVYVRATIGAVCGEEGRKMLADGNGQVSPS